MSAKDQIKQIVDYFKRENYLKDKTEAMGEGLMLGASLADESNERSKEAVDTTLAVQEKYKEQILAQDLNPNKDPELVDLRNGNTTAGERITKFEQQTDDLFAQTDEKITELLYDVKRFGAVGDGITDDTLAIQSAIDFIESNSGFAYNAIINVSRKLFFPSTPNSYLVSGTLLTSKVLSFKGEGKNSTLIKKTGDSPLFKIDTNIIINTRHIKFKGMTLKGEQSYDDFAPETNQNGILIDNSLPDQFIDSLQLDDVDIIGMTGTGLWSKTNAQSHRITNCKIEGNGGAGVRIGGSYNTDLRMFYNIIRHNRIGVQFTPDAGKYAGSVWLVQNLIEANSMGSGKAGTGDHTSTSLTGRPCIGISLLRCQRIFIKENYFEYHLNDILLDKSSYNSISGNWGFSSSNAFGLLKRYGNGLQRKLGIFVMSGSTGNQVRNNDFLEPPTRPADTSHAEWNSKVWTNLTQATSKATVTNGSKKVTLTTGAWLDAATLVPTMGYGPKIVFGVDVPEYRVDERISNTEITLERAYTGATGVVDYQILSYGSTYEHVTDLNGINSYQDNIYQDIMGVHAEIGLTNKNNRHYSSCSVVSGGLSRRVEKMASKEVGFGSRVITDDDFTHKEVLGRGLVTKDITEFPSNTPGAKKETVAIGGSGGTPVVVKVENPFGKSEELWSHENKSIKHSYGIALPTTGTGTVGDIVYRETPFPNGYIGYVCVTSGTPGVWKNFGKIDA